MLSCMSLWHGCDDFHIGKAILQLMFLSAASITVRGHNKKKEDPDSPTSYCSKEDEMDTYFQVEVNKKMDMQPSSTHMVLHRMRH